MENPELQLTQEERSSALWAKIVKWAHQRVDSHRKRNDNDQTIEQTASIRGQIREAKALISLGREKPEFVTPGAKPTPTSRELGY